MDSGEKTAAGGLGRGLAQIKQELRVVGDAEQRMEGIAQHARGPSAGVPDELNRYAPSLVLLTSRAMAFLGNQVEEVVLQGPARAQHSAPISASPLPETPAVTRPCPPPLNCRR